MQLQHLLCEDVTFDFVNFAVEICSHSATGAVVGSVIILRGKALSAVGESILKVCIRSVLCAGLLSYKK